MARAKLTPGVDDYDRHGNLKEPERFGYRGNGNGGARQLPAPAGSIAIPSGFTVESGDPFVTDYHGTINGKRVDVREIHMNGRRDFSCYVDGRPYFTAEPESRAKDYLRRLK